MPMYQGVEPINWRRERDSVPRVATFVSISMTYPIFRSTRPSALETRNLLIIIFNLF